MSPERYQFVKAIFHKALELPPAHRAAYVSHVCGGDELLRRQVEDLLRSDAQQTSYLDRSPVAPLSRAVASPEAAPPTRVGPYEIQGELGRGGMGAVFLASRADDVYRKRVAIKLLLRDHENTAVFERFRRERQILANLDHPNIAALLDGGATADGIPYLVMEYVEGQPIDTYCNSLGLPANARLQLFLTVCAAVQHAHQNLVIHRDLKPSNILVRSDGTVKLLDFGIAKLLSAEPGQELDRTATGMRMLTPHFASPEQLRGEPMTTATDVYQLAVTLYQLLTNRHPFGEGEASALLQRMLTSEPIPPRAIQPNLDRDLDAILLKALARDAANRYPSVAQFAEDIRRHLTCHPVTARGTQLSYLAGRFVRRNKAIAGAAVAFLLVLVAALAWGLNEARMASAASQRALARERELTTELASAYHQLADATPDNQAAIALYRKVLAMGEPASVADAHLALAARLASTGDSASALAHVDSALKLFPSGPVAAAARARRTNTVTANLARNGAHDSALRLARSAIQSAQQHLAEEPSNHAFRLELALAEHGYGRAAALAGLRAEASQALASALTHYQALAVDAPSILKDRADLAAVYTDLADFYAAVGDTARAQEYRRRAVRP